MAGQPARVFSREFKEAAVRRVLAGERVSAVAAELQLKPQQLYVWWSRYDRGGPEALLPPGRPPRSAGGAKRPPPAPSARPRKGRPHAKSKRGSPEQETEAERVAELERKVGQQALELDFFARALRHVKASARPSDGRGAGASSP